MSKSGFSTLNRWLGRKNKDKSVSNNKLSKSSTNLSISSTNINETSQLEYNRITPLPAATTNAPFEQTFRITVLLPKDQLYVTRLGARVPLSKLLELVCDNKLLDEEKYEFRNPVDPSQVYSCDLTIGAVGLSEIRLCHKSASYDNFNSDEIIKLHRTSLIRESLSSSEFSSRNSKHTTKTTSPYSSTNSLNSMDSSAVSCGRSGKLPLTGQSKMLAPPRKKRAAPRPPSQTAIPEKSPLIIENGPTEEQQRPPQESPLTTKDFSISTPNLTSSTMLHSDINGNDFNGNVEDLNDMSSGNGSLNSHGYGEDTVLYAQIQKKNALNLSSQTKSDLAEPYKDIINSKLPEPSPRQKIAIIKKKTAAPPAPPPRNSLYQEDAVSIASTTSPVESELSKSPTNNFEECTKPAEESKTLSNSLPTPVPRITTSTTLLNATDIENDIKHITSDSEESKAKPNISKVMLNRTPTPEPRSLSCEPPEVDHCYDTQLEQFKQQGTEEDCVSKQADSGIGEPVPSPLPDSLPSEVSNLDVKAHFESSSDDDDMVKVYNFKLGKTLVKPISETKTLEELTIINNGPEETDSEITTSLIMTQATTPNNLSESSSLNFAIPISPPPNFADNKFGDNIPSDPQSDIPITPKIMERPILNFENLKQEQEELPEVKELQLQKPIQTISTPLNNMVHELSSIIQDKGVDSLIKKTEAPEEIEAAKPNTLSNFSINAIAKTNNTISKEVLSENSPKTTHPDNVDFAKPLAPLSSPSSPLEEEKLYRKRSSVTSLKQRRSVTRSDSFHTTAAPTESIDPNKRTFSQLSLDQMAGNLNRQRSSSELSIGESPSLQSLEVIKTILNSRKNSLANNSGGEDKEIEVNARRPSDELKFASLELKTLKASGKTEKEDNVSNMEETKNVVQEEKPKEIPKVYRYSGPPSINFSTWSERPKSQVAIKNEGDYIFGGAKNNKDIKYYRLSSPVSSSETPPIAPKPATIQRMGIPEKDYKVPVLVKPLQDVVATCHQVPTMQKEETKNVENSYKKAQISGEIQNAIQSTQRPTVESVLRPQTQIIINSSTNTYPRHIIRPTVEAVLRPQTQIIVNTSTLPRVNRQGLTTPAVVAGPQLLRSCSTKQQQQQQQQQGDEKTCSKQVIIPGPQILRSSSIKQQEIKNSCTPAMQESSQAPFGQNTLRRTGFKEKILAKEEENKQQNYSNCQTPPNTPTTPIQEKFLTNGGLKLSNQKFSNSLKSAKLHLNIKSSNTLTSQQMGNTKTASPSFSYPTTTDPITLVAPALKPKPTTPAKTETTTTTTANTFAFNTNGTITNPPPPPPPATSLQCKTVRLVCTATKSNDSRDELLAAIRNFNKESLKKA